MIAPFSIVLVVLVELRRHTLTTLHAITEKREHTIHKVSTKPHSKSNHQQTRQARANPMGYHWRDDQPDNKPFSI